MVAQRWQPWLLHALHEPPKAGRLAVRVTSPMGAREVRLLVLRADRTLKRGPSPLERIRGEWLDVLEREQQGYSTTNALLSVVASLQEMPGRKTIVFFSEGLAVPPAAQAAFRSVVDTANRANVTIYAVDASGLRAESTIADVRREMTAAGTDRIVQAQLVED